MIRNTLTVVTVLVFSLYADVAVFPVRSVNADRSYGDAMGAVLSQKYAQVSKEKVLSPFESGKALGQDTNYLDAAQKLGVSEYITIEAIGLFLSRKEKYDVSTSSGNATDQKIIVHLAKDDDDDDDDDDDQDLLDKSKTIVTAIRFAADGSEIHRAQMTLVTYGDIEESSDRFAKALYRKVHPDQVQDVTNITRREGMGYNKKYLESIKGVRFGFLAPLSTNDQKYAANVTIGYNMLIESEKLLLQFGAGAMIPSAMEDTKRYYGGVYFDIGAGGLIGNTNSPVIPFLGGGINPLLNFATATSGMEMGLAPYVNFGILSSRALGTRMYCAFRFGVNLLPITTREKVVVDNGGWPDWEYVSHKDHPIELGLQFGIGW